MTVKIEESWGRVLSPEFEKDYFRELTDFVKSEYATHTIYPKGKDIFRAFDACPFNDVKVVILGQDPYHGPGQANGLCFSVHEGVTFPPSLVNIFKEIRNDLGKEIPPNGSLERWARQGVLLLNATLTVRAHQAGSHQNKGWETFTDAVVKALASQKKGLVYMLWGSYAQKKASIVSANENLVLKSPHPSPLSAHRGFFGCGHFSKANRYLEEKGLGQIEW
ncbi:uracil-DNA glycosylase [Roseivirga sp. UBA838]|uniref:uracil-DNA glycosylase n=1 Tax=Roseivirga sp. UBA838 TaxID=1947393 RepID=UPI00257F738E|nr:uracil-DNA glycosylase [Roseivirga sp. UBA838]|tara:strand:- start:6721 stop:7383 length:663 start_codon:yes stop_codon:yes gene_type:complete